MTEIVIIEASGKKQLWENLMRQCGIEAEAIATNGHITRYPDSLDPLGIDILPRPRRRAAVIERLRQDNNTVSRQILATVSRLRPVLSAIHIASDADDEGDVIAWDVARILYRADPSLVPLIRRTLPRAMTRTGIAAAIRTAKPLDPLHLAIAAIPGRARALFDRLAGASLSRPGIPASRVRTAILGGIGLLTNGGISKRRIETGEILLRARVAGPGRMRQPAIARIACHGLPDPVLSAIAREYAGGFVPGVVRPLTAAGAMPVMRTGQPHPCGTAEALIIAARHHTLAPKAAMEGLQKAYMDGIVSYPRVETGVGNVLEDVCRIANHNGIPVSVPEGPEQETDPRHEPLHPVVASDNNDGSLFWWRDVLAMPDNLAPSMDPENGPRDRMASIVARRAIEAAMPCQEVPCTWDEGGDQGLPDEWRDALARLDWHFEDGPRPFWPRALSTGARQWPPASQLIEFMTAERLGRPSTVADHVELLLASGTIDFEPWALPSLNPDGLKAIDGPSAALAAPAVSRNLEDILHLARDRAGENLANTGQLDIGEWISGAALEMLASVDSGTRGTMLRFAGFDPETVIEAFRADAKAPKSVQVTLAPEPGSGGDHDHNSPPQSLPEDETEDPTPDF